MSPVRDRYPAQPSRRPGARPSSFGEAGRSGVRYSGAMNKPRGTVIGYWIATALLCLHMGFTAYAQLRLPQVAAAFTHLGFPDYFRVQLSWAKFLGIVLLLAP